MDHFSLCHLQSLHVKWPLALQAHPKLAEFEKEALRLEYDFEIKVTHNIVTGSQIH